MALSLTQFYLSVKTIETKKTVATCGAGKGHLITAEYNEVKFRTVVLNTYLA